MPMPLHTPNHIVALRLVQLARTEQLMHRFFSWHGLGIAASFTGLLVAGGHVVAAAVLATTYCTGLGFLCLRHWRLTTI